MEGAFEAKTELNPYRFDRSSHANQMLAWDPPPRTPPTEKLTKRFDFEWGEKGLGILLQELIHTLLEADRSP